MADRPPSLETGGAYAVAQERWRRTGSVMKAAIHIGVLAVAVAVLSPSLVAQWPEYPDKTIPRKADGTVNMDAPVPRAADGKPDFTGVWRGLGAPGPGRGRGNQPPPPPPAGPPVAGFRDVAQNIPGGAPMTPWAQELLKKRMARNSLDNPEAHCLPFGLVQFHTQGFPRKFVQTPKLMVILYEASSGIRQIFTDGRPLPKLGDPEPFYYGYSTGRWEGDTLVVESNNFVEDGWLDIIGTPFTEQGRLTERFRRVSYGRMEIDITIEDPKAYTKPWTVRHNQELMPDGELIEFVCLENQRFGAEPGLGPALNRPSISKP
jgi:hypothetical protein